MGAAVTLASDTPIDLTTAQTIAGDRWNEELQAQFLLVLQSHQQQQQAGASPPSLTLNELKQQFPLLFETEEEKKQRLYQEYLLILQQRSEGDVIINYQMYNESFPISGNTLTAERINEDYGLTDVMPGCQIKLSTIDSKARTLYSNAHDGNEAPWVREDPVGTFRDLLSGETYYCLVIENPEQYAKDMAELTQRLQAEGKLITDEKRNEGCSCLYGNPCVDQYICKDWDNRYAVAKKNGWKGF